MVSYRSVAEEIKKTADIVEVIGQFVQLRKAGNNYVGLCPFHSEKAPSFSVSPARQMFHCFGCKKGGDVFAFWMEYHKTGFQEALKDLAARYRVEIPDADSSPAERRKRELGELLFRVNDLAASYFQKVLVSHEKGLPGRTYLNRRGISDDIVTRFRLGYAPDEWNGLTSTLARRKVPAALSVQAGLIVSKKSGGHYDRFRGRIIFPIFNLKNEVEGFGGRVLDDSLPKYLNTPETPVFHKGASLYGLHDSFKEIRDKGRVVVVEGYMDFLALKQKGLNEVVATLGTALTGEHVRRMKGFAGEAVVVFDSDEAGRAAALRSLPLFMNEGLPAKAVVLPDGHDPDTFVNAHGLSRFEELLENAFPLFEFFLDQVLRGSGSGVDEKVHALKVIIPILAELREETQRSLYVGRLSERMGIKEEVLLWGLRSRRGSEPEGAFERGLQERLTSSGVKKSIDDHHFLNLLIHYPLAAERLADCEWELLLSDPLIIEIVKSFFIKYREEGPFPIQALSDRLDEKTQGSFREALLSSPFYSEQMVGQAVMEFEEKIHQIGLARSIRRARERGDTERLVELTKLKAQRGLKA